MEHSGCGYVEGSSWCGECGKTSDRIDGFYYRPAVSNSPTGWVHPVTYEEVTETAEYFIEQLVKARMRIREQYDEIATYRAAAELFEAQRDAAREAIQNPRVDLVYEGPVNEEYFIKGKRLWENMSTGEWTTDTKNLTDSVPRYTIVRDENPSE